jgi:zinc transport system substrate-binding protein
MLDPLVAGRGDVAVLLKPGASSHTYEPAPSDAATAARCTAFFWVGGDFDGFAAQLDAPQKIQLLPLAPPSMLLTDMDQDEATPGSGGGSAVSADAEPVPGTRPAPGAAPDPHILCDPLLVQAILPALVRELTRVDPPGAAQYAANAQAFAARLDALHAELAALLAPAKGQAALVFHPSFNYMFKRYGIVLAGEIERFPGKEPSPKYLQELTRRIKAQHVRAIFGETLLSKQPTQVLAEGAGVPVLELDPSCGNSGHDYSDYRDWLVYNARILRDALAP